MKVQDPDEPFRHYTAKHHVVAWISQRLFDNVTYTVRHGLIKGMKRKGGLAWVPGFVAGSATDTAEQSFWMQLNLKDLVIYDVGAFHGLLTLYFAQKGREVISYEPNSRNYARLMDNLQLNEVKNVRVRKVGVGSKSEIATMVVSPLMAGGASIESDTVAGLLNSKQPVISEQIPITALDDDIREHSLPAPGFLKIDVEGGELAVLEGARNTLRTHKPQLFLEMHGETMNLKLRKVAEIVNFLEEAGYDEIHHIESGTRIQTGNSSVAAEGHLYCP
jgi:FkbM family methyltransferase